MTSPVDLAVDAILAQLAERALSGEPNTYVSNLMAVSYHCSMLFGVSGYDNFNEYRNDVLRALLARDIYL